MLLVPPERVQLSPRLKIRTTKMLDLLPVSSVKKYLDKILPQGWEAFETETIVMELGFNPLRFS